MSKALAQVRLLKGRLEARAGSTEVAPELQRAFQRSDGVVEPALLEAHLAQIIPGIRIGGLQAE